MYSKPYRQWLFLPGYLKQCHQQTPLSPDDLIVIYFSYPDFPEMWQNVSQAKQLYISINTGTVLTKWYVKPYSCYLTLTLRDGHIDSYVLRKKIFSNFLKLFCYSSNLSFWFPGYYQFKMSQVSMTLWPGFQSISFLQHFQIMVTLQFNFSCEVFGS